MLEFIITNVEEILIAITSIIAGASALAALTPTKKDDIIFKWLTKFLDYLALNIGYAKRSNSPA